jgi:hypothetical protein
MRGLLIKRGPDNYRLYVGEVAYATTGESPLKKLSLKNCQSIERGYDLDELAKEVYRDFPLTSKDDLSRWGQDVHAPKKQKAYKKGFMKALELVSDKRFSRGDVAYILNTMQIDDISFDEAIIKLQSLQQSEWVVEVEMRCLVSASFQMLDFSKDPIQTTGKVDLGCMEERPKLDENKCLILKRIINA